MVGENTAEYQSQSPTPNQIIMSTTEDNIGIMSNRGYNELTNMQDGIMHSVPEYMQSVKSNQYLQMMLNAAATG